MEDLGDNELGFKCWETS